MAQSETRGIERYLLGEMKDEERIKLEEQLLTDDQFFYEVCERENSLVDRFVSDSLKGSEAARFREALGKTPALAEKVANARALRGYLASERKSENPVAEASPGIWNRITNLLSFASPVPTFAMGGLLLIFAIGFGLLVLENGRRNAEVARLEAELSKTTRSSARETELERELTTSRSREAELQGQIDGEKGVTGDLTADLARERENRRKLESEIEALRKESATPVKRPTPSGIEPPNILAVTLTPAGARGGDSHRVNFEGGAKRISVVMTLPPTVAKSERISVRVNGREIARNLPVNEGQRGSKSLAITVSRSQLNTGENLFAAIGGSGDVLSDYRLIVGAEEK